MKKNFLRNLSLAKYNILVILTVFFGIGYSLTFIYVNKFKNNNSNFYGGLISLSVGIIFVIILLIIESKTFETKRSFSYDNKKLFKSPFSKKYWLKSKTELKSVKQVTLLSLLLGLVVVTNLIPIPSGFANLKIGLTYLVLAVSSMIYGPIVALLIGFLSDNLGFFMNPSSYGYIPGYVLSTMAACFTYAIFFYRTRITFAKVLFSRIIINFIINAFFGSMLWIITIKGNGFAEWQQSFLYIFLPKNIAYLIPQTIVLYLFLKAISPTLVRFSLIEDEQGSNIHLF